MNNVRRFLKTYEALLGWGALAVVAVLGLLLGVIPAARTVFTVFKDTRTLREEIERLSVKSQTLSSYTTEALGDVVRELASAAPSDKSVGTLFGTVDGVAKRTNVSITGLNLESVGSVASGSSKSKPSSKSEESKTGAKVLSATVAVEGNLDNVRSFLDTIVKVRRLILVKNFELGTSEKTGLLTARINLESYYIPSPTTIGKASDTIDPFSAQELALVEKLISYSVVFETVSLTGESGSSPANPDPFSP